MSQEEIKLEFAIWLYEKDKVSLRKAAKIAGLAWIDLAKCYVKEIYQLWK